MDKQVITQLGGLDGELSATDKEKFLDILKSRFEKNIKRHEDIKWNNVLEKLEKNLNKLYSLYQMEITGGEPDVVEYDNDADEYIFFDCSAESPIGRRSLCYDNEALEARKANKPLNSAMGIAKQMGIEILSEEKYRKLQDLGDFDLKTSSWVKTPANIRKLGGALFCDKRYDNVFLYHNGADSYYSARGFRGFIKI